MNVPLQPIVIILLGHWIGDYLLQSNDMAANKGSSMAWLILHVIVYSTVLFSISLWFFSWEAGIEFTLLNGLLHFVTDLFTRKLSFRYRAMPRVFYPIVGFDQLIHSLTLIVTIYLFSKAEVL